MTPDDLGWVDLLYVFIAAVSGVCAAALALKILFEVIPQAWRRMRG